MRVALVHDWLTGMRGGEKVLAELGRMFPRAPLHTLLRTTDELDPLILDRPIRTSWLHALPGVGRYYRHLLPILPGAIESMDVGAVDLVVSTNHCVAKAIRRDRAALHVCYCFSPMRYAWDLAGAYAQRLGLTGRALSAAGPWLRAWDRRTASRVDRFVAISQTIAERIRRCYGRESDIVYPPYDEAFFTPDPAVEREDFYLYVSALAPYKRADLVVEALTRLDRPVVVIGAGQLAAELAAKAGPRVKLLGWRSDEEIRDHYRRCRALVFPALEDFGIVPVEAQACGAPVIAYNAGGAVETVRDAAGDNPTGVLFEPQSVDGLIAAVERFEALGAETFSPPAMNRWARRFSRPAFAESFRSVLQRELASRRLI
jgi:glycosyltransferase involved in cell wall biosynthesis